MCRGPGRERIIACGISVQPAAIRHGKMKSSLDDRIARAAELAGAYPGASSLLNFYGELAEFQKSIFEALRSKGQTEGRALAHYFPELIELVRHSGPKPLADSSAKLTAELLAEQWEGSAEYDPAG